jgi:DNA polymerase-4
LNLNPQILEPFVIVDRIILHIDMDAFFISVEQRDDPSLRGKPAAVCGSLSRSVVTSATYEARPYGIRAGMSTQEAKRRCPQLILVEGHHSKYTETASRILGKMHPDEEKFYLDLLKAKVQYLRTREFWDK